MSEFDERQMGPQAFLQQLNSIQDRLRNDLRETSLELRNDLKTVAGELQKVSNTLLIIQAQDLGTQLAKLRDGEIATQAKRIEGLERDVVKAHTTIKVLATIGSLAITILAIWVSWRH